jgi:hypothetical protein
VQSGEGYICSVKSNNARYRTGAFDFLAAYVIPEDAWHIIPAKVIRGVASVSLCTSEREGKYEEYRKAWHLLRKATECGEAENEPAVEPEEVAMGPGMRRMQASMNFIRNYFEKGPMSG